MSALIADTWLTISGGTALGEGDTETAGLGIHNRSSGAVIKDGGASWESVLVPAVAELTLLAMLWILGARGGTLDGSMLGALEVEPVELELDTVWT